MDRISDDQWKLAFLGGWDGVRLLGRQLNCYPNALSWRDARAPKSCET